MTHAVACRTDLTFLTHLDAIGKVGDVVAQGEIGEAG